MLTNERIDEIAGPADYWDRRVFARAIEAAAVAPLLERIAQKQTRIDQLIQEVAAGADVEAAQRERIAALEAKLAYANEVIDQRNAMVSAALSAAPAAPEQQEPASPWPGIDVAKLLSHAMKPEDIAGAADKQHDRVGELLGWFVRLTDNQANPKWTREHAYELAYYIATNGMNRNIDLGPIREASFAEGVNVSDDERRILNRFRPDLYPPAQAPNAQQAPQASTIADAARDVAKCLNERDGKGLDLRHVAMLVNHAQQAEAQEPEYWQWRRKADVWSLKNVYIYEVFATTDDSEVRQLFTRPQPAQLQALSEEELKKIFHASGFDIKYADYVQSALAAKNGSVLK